eukprot:CAMPEP_0116877628 /NCGR_PEP_ID=MMETSP0463-20121206/9387_1 /TAXON_ID=181622 /ORGANISM="Strombidinopsis sp, Strain SopsisLIS2011" /LENGTH=34 /DNA_ID= /DNA_START= /DNA_END= /DNA_ORIENTATION=
MPDKMTRNRINGDSLWAIDKPYEDFEYNPTQGLI